MRPRPPRKQLPPRKDQPPTERVQKLLSAAGVGSRREVERWIREGRLQVNGEVPALGAKLAPRDRITLDGRPVRLHAPAVKELHVLLFHRSPGETLDLKAATSRAAEHLNLPRSSGRWLAIQPMPPVDGGLEILTDDGSWAHRVSRGVHALTVDYVLRMRGPLSNELVEGAVWRRIQSLAQRDGARHSLRAGAALVGGTRHHREPLDARALRAGAPVARIAAGALAGHASERAQRVDERDRRSEAGPRTGSSVKPRIARMSSDSHGLGG